MASLNRATIIGNLGRDPEVRYLPDGGAVTNVSIATTEKWKDKSGEPQERVEWHRVTFFGKLAEVAGEYLKKGAQIFVEGRIVTRKWQDKEGNDKYTTEIHASQMQMLGGKPREDGETPKQAAPKPQKKSDDPLGIGEPGDRFGGFEDDLPFDRIRHEHTF